MSGLTLPVDPMLADAGPVTGLAGDKWAFEPKWDGYRGIVEVNHGTFRIWSRSGRDVTGEFPSLSWLGGMFPDSYIVLDGEVVVLDEAGVPRFNLVQNHRSHARVDYWAFDVLAYNRVDTMRAPYATRREVLEKLGVLHDLTVPDLITASTGGGALEHSNTMGWEGIVAKRWDSAYRPGRRGPDWLKGKNWRHQEIVVGGWRAGSGRRAGTIGALLMGVPGAGGLDFVGAVGTGFTDDDLAYLLDVLTPIRTSRSPFNSSLPAAERRVAQFVSPIWVGEVQYGERTGKGILRQPSWRGLRTDKTPNEIRLEN